MILVCPKFDNNFGLLIWIFFIFFFFGGCCCCCLAIRYLLYVYIKIHCVLPTFNRRKQSTIQKFCGHYAYVCVCIPVLVINIPENSQLFYYLICDHLYLKLAVGVFFSLPTHICIHKLPLLLLLLLLLLQKDMHIYFSLSIFKPHIIITDDKIQRWHSLYCLKSH